MARRKGCEGQLDECQRSGRVALSISSDGEYGEAGWGEARLVRHVGLALDLHVDPLSRKGSKRCKRCRPPQVDVGVVPMACHPQRRYKPCRCAAKCLLQKFIAHPLAARYAPGCITANAATNAQWRRDTRDDEDHDAGTRWRPNGPRGDAACVA